MLKDAPKSPGEVVISEPKACACCSVHLADPLVLPVAVKGDGNVWIQHQSHHSCSFPGSWSLSADGTRETSGGFQTSAGNALPTLKQYVALKSICFSEAKEVLGPTGEQRWLRIKCRRGRREMLTLHHPFSFQDLIFPSISFAASFGFWSYVHTCHCCDLPS